MVIGEKVKAKTDELTQIHNSGVLGTASRIQKLINNTAFEIINYCDYTPI